MRSSWKWLRRWVIYLFVFFSFKFGQQWLFWALSYDSLSDYNLNRVWVFVKSCSFRLHYFRVRQVSSVFMEVCYSEYLFLFDNYCSRNYQPGHSCFLGYYTLLLIICHVYFFFIAWRIVYCFSQVIFSYNACSVMDEYWWSPKLQLCCSFKEIHYL